MSDAVTAPRVGALTKGTQGGSAIAPNCKVEGEEEGDERGGMSMRKVQGRGKGRRLGF